MLKQKESLLALRNKIYIKQRNLMIYMHENNIDSWEDPKIKLYIGEINLLDEVLEQKFNQYREEQTIFWEN